MKPRGVCRMAAAMRGIWENLLLAVGLVWAQGPAETNEESEAGED